MLQQRDMVTPSLVSRLFVNHKRGVTRSTVAVLRAKGRIGGSRADVGRVNVTALGSGWWCHQCRSAAVQASTSGGSSRGMSMGMPAFSMPWPS